MTTEAIVEELEAMQKDLSELRRVLNIASTRHHKMSNRINMLKRRLNAQIRKDQEATHTTHNDENKNQLSLNFREND